MSLTINYNSIDVFKFLMALFVVTIHTNIATTIENIFIARAVYSIINTAVPFFLLSSVFLLLNKHSGTNWGGHLKKLFKLYIEWSIIHFVLTSIILRDFSFARVIDFIYRFFFSGYFHYWYIWASILAILILNRIIKRGGGVSYLLIAIASYTVLRVGLYLIYYFDLYNEFGLIISGVKNILIALTYFSIGVWSHTKNIKNEEGILLIITGFIMAIAGLDSSGKEIAIYVPFLSFGLFVIVKNTHFTSSIIPFQFMRTMSSYIYFCHGIVVCLVGCILLSPSVLSWLVCLVASIVTAYAIIKLKVILLIKK